MVLGGNLLHRGTQLRQTLSQSLNRLRCLLLQVAQLSQLSVLLLSNTGDFLRVRVAHRRISLQQGATGASVQLLQRNLRNGGVVTRRAVGTLRLLLRVILLAAAVHRVTTSTHGRRSTHTEHTG